uniref:Chloroplast psaE n=1 Tax=Karlodinium veneficum TaxID=407301 RepID=Q2IA57_KARVE|nr:chloroplast psaE [Karlodinium veneficum]
MGRVSLAFVCTVCSFKSLNAIKPIVQESQERSLAMLLLAAHPASQPLRRTVQSDSSRSSSPQMIERGSVVRIMRPESYWFKDVGTVAAVSKGDDRYPVTVRFEKCNFAGITTNNYAMDELIEVAKPKGKAKGKAKAKAKAKSP